MALPGSYRWAVTLAVIVGFQVALSAGFDIDEALHVDSPSLMGEETALVGTGLTPQAQRQVWLAKRSGYQTAVTGMLPWRLVSSGLLAAGAGLVFIFAMRLRLAAEGRARAAELLGFAAIGAAFLRSIDGAQNLVIARTVATETGRVLIAEGIQDAQLAASALSTASTVISIAWSLLMVAIFMSLAGYFRSESLRAALGKEG